MSPLERKRGQRAPVRAAAWASLIAVAVLSLMPAQQMQRTGLGGHVEHVLAYGLTAVIFAAAYVERGTLKIVLALLGYAACLEFLQRLSPGRSSNLLDFTMSGAGVLIGVGAFVLLSRRWRLIGSTVDPVSRELPR